MKKYLILVAVAVLGLQINPALAQFGGGASPGGFKMDGALKKVFGENICVLCHAFGPGQAQVGR